MGRLLVRRVAQTIPTLVGVSVLIFLLVRLLPGDVVDLLSAGDAASDESREAIRRSLRLDEPLPAQYLQWVGDLLTGSLGVSLRTGESITDQLGRALPITLEIVLIGTVLALAVGVPLGILSASRPGSWMDSVGRVIGMVGIAIPSFWLATLLLLLTSAVFGWVPSSQYISPFEDPLGSLGQMFLPGLCISVYLMAMVMRMLRATMLETLGEDYIRTARAKGVSRRGVVLHHALRNALVPVITVTAFEIGVLLAATALIEVVFGMPGLGNTLVQAITYRDYPMVQAVTMLLAVIFIGLNLLADVAAAVIDPRVEEE